ncbi:MAG: hypothetical protein HPY82_11360 [Gammaproteobacteria bacterium]|nr:hypothetical protein [Gammaproteobacteria bacterium]
MMAQAGIPACPPFPAAVFKNPAKTISYIAAASGVVTNPVHVYVWPFFSMPESLMQHSGRHLRPS